MKITFYGHACFLIDTGSEKLLTDPFLTGNPCAAIRAEAVEADYILVSHGHSDHVGDAAAIAKRTGASIVSTIDTYGYFFGKDKLPAVVGNIGGTVKAGSASVKYVSAIHGSGVPGGLACGFVISAGGKKVYFAGDTALSADMMLLKEENLDAALLPIGDCFTMGPADAVRAAELCGAKLAIPMHFKTFPLLVQDADGFAAAAEAKGVAAKVLAPGESMEL